MAKGEKRTMRVSPGHVDIVKGWYVNENGDPVYQVRYCGRNWVFHEPWIKDKATEMELERIKEPV